MKKKPFRFTTQIALRETTNGLLWCLAAIIWFFDNPQCRIIYIILLTLAVLCQGFSIFGKFEKSDEMAIANLRAAKSISLDYTRILLLIISIIIIIIPDDTMAGIDWSKIIHPTVNFFIGLPEVITGIMFKHIEEE